MDFSFDIVGIINWFMEMPELQVYVWVLILMTIESSFIPFPSEIVVPPAAFLAAHGNAHIGLVFLFATLGAMLGATLNYTLAWFLGRPIIYRLAESNFGKVCLIDKAKVERAEKYFEQHGAVATLIGRLVPVIRQLISIPAGLSKMNFWKFLVYTGIGAGIWNSVLTILGFVLGKSLSKDVFMTTIEHYNSVISQSIMMAFLVGLAIVGYKAYRKRVKSDKEELTK